MSILLAAGASAAATDEDGKTPLVWAASQGHEAAVGQHVEKRRLGRVPAAWPPLRFGRSILQIDTACARCMHARPGRGCRVGRCSTAGWSPGQPLDPPVGRAPVGRSQHRCSGELQRGGGGRQGAAARRGGSIHGREHDGQGTREKRVVSRCSLPFRLGLPFAGVFLLCWVPSVSFKHI